MNFVKNTIWQCEFCKMRFRKCEFCGKCDFGNVNFVKIEILEMWILSKMRHRKCEFRGKWDFGNVNFVENETLKLWISWKMRLFWWLFNYCVIIFHATNLCRRTIRCLGHIHKFWSSNFSSRENAKVNKLCPTAKQGRSPAKLDFHFLLTLPRQIKPIGAAAQTTLEFLQKKGRRHTFIMSVFDSALKLLFFCFAENEIALFFAGSPARLQIAIFQGLSGISRVPKP